MPGALRVTISSHHQAEEELPMILVRRLLGDVLRHQRQQQGRTLRQVSSAARVSLGYLSEVERGQKEASSELLGAICTALDVPLSTVLREVSDELVIAEALQSMPADAVGGERLLLEPVRDRMRPPVDGVSLQLAHAAA